MRTWDGLFVCRADWETRHPQDFVRGRKDIQNVPNPRPEPAEDFIGPTAAILTESDAVIQDEGGLYLMVEQ
jgi:hypothetical protein